MRITTYMRQSGTDRNGADRRGGHCQWNSRRFDSAGVVPILERRAALGVFPGRITDGRRLSELTKRLQSSLTRLVNAATRGARRRMAGPALILDSERDRLGEPWAAIGVEAVTGDQSGLGTPLCRFSGP